MANEFDYFDEAIIGSLSQIGIEIINDKNTKELGSLVPKTIYEITKDVKMNNKDNNTK